jgi:hypothetical protein
MRSLVRFQLAPQPARAPNGSPGSLRLVKAFKRLMLVLGIAGLIGALARLRGKGGVPPTTGGWRELDGPDFR